MWQRRDLIFQLTRREIKNRYKGTYLGLCWPMIVPLFMLTVYSFVFGVILKSSWPYSRTGGMVEFGLTLLSGIVMFNVFSDTLGASATLIVTNPNYVKKIVFPLEILPVVVLNTAIFHGALSLAILFLGTLVFVGAPGWWVLSFPFILVSLCAFTLGLGWIIAALGVFIRDMSHSLNLLLQVGFLCTPIFYDPSRIPERFRWLVAFNPLAAFVMSGRDVLLWRRSPNWIWLGVMMFSSLIVMQAGYIIFVKSKKAFSDVL